jgi:hypothetical protein
MTFLAGNDVLHRLTGEIKARVNYLPAMDYLQNTDAV